MTPEQVLADLDHCLDDPLSLVVGRSLEQGGDLRRVRLANDAAETFRGYSRAARARIAEGTPIEYTALAELQAGEYFVLQDASSLNELAELRSAVHHVGDLAPVSPRDLDADIGFYAVGVGSGDDRVAFIRRTDPRLLAKPGRLLAIGRERLEAVSEPIVTFTEAFDLVIGPGRARSWCDARFSRRRWYATRRRASGSRPDRGR